MEWFLTPTLNLNLTLTLIGRLRALGDCDGVVRDEVRIEDEDSLSLPEEPELLPSGEGWGKPLGPNLHHVGVPRRRTPDLPSRVAF